MSYQFTPPTSDEQPRTEADAQDRPRPQPKRKPSGLTGVNAELARLFADRYEKEQAS